MYLYSFISDHPIKGRDCTCFVETYHCLLRLVIDHIVCFYSAYI